MGQIPRKQISLPDRPPRLGVRDPPAALDVPKAQALFELYSAHLPQDGTSASRNPAPTPHLLLHVGVAESHGESEARWVGDWLELGYEKGWWENRANKT